MWELWYSGIKMCIDSGVPQLPHWPTIYEIYIQSSIHARSSTLVLVKTPAFWTVLYSTYEPMHYIMRKPWTLVPALQPLSQTATRKHTTSMKYLTALWNIWQLYEISDSSMKYLTALWNIWQLYEISDSFMMNKQQLMLNSCLRKKL